MRVIDDPKDKLTSLWSFFTPNDDFLVINADSLGVFAWDLSDDSVKPLSNWDKNSSRTIKWSDLETDAKADPNLSSKLLAIVTDQYKVGSGFGGGGGFDSRGVGVLTASPKVLEEVMDVIPFVAEDARVLSVSPDGRFAAGLGRNGRIKSYDLQKGTNMVPYGHLAPVVTVTASPDNKLLASGAFDQRVRVWDRKTGEQLSMIQCKSSVNSCCFSPDSNLLAFGDNQSNFYLFNVQEETLQTYAVGDRLTDLTFARDGKSVFILGRRITTFDVASRTKISEISAGNAVQGSIAISPDGQVIAGSYQSLAPGKQIKGPTAWSINDRKLAKIKEPFPNRNGAPLNRPLRCFFSGWNSLSRKLGKCDQAMAYAKQESNWSTNDWTYQVSCEAEVLAGWKTLGFLQLGWHSTSLGCSNEPAIDGLGCRRKPNL